MAGVEISRAYVGVAGADVRCVNARGMVSVARKDREIAQARHPARARARRSRRRCPPTARSCTPSPQEFVVDEQGGITDPLGMLGSRLEVQVHLVTGQVARSKTLLTCVNRAGIEVAEMVFEPLATAEAVLTPGRARPRRAAHRHRRRHHRLRALLRRRDPALGGPADRRRPLHQRPGDGAAHALRRGRADQDPGGLLPALDGAGGGGHLGAGGRRRRAARRAEARDLRDPAAARRGAASRWCARTWARTAGTGSCAAASC